MASKIVREWRAAKEHHYNFHSRTLDIEECNQKECVAAVKARRKDIVGEDIYTGDYKQVYALFPDVEIEDSSRAWHEHGAYCGGNYIHKHKGGTLEHVHPHERCSYCH